MKKTLVLFLLISLCNFSFAYMKGDKLTVHAPSGLNMRATKGSAGKKIVRIPYGAKVTIAADSTERKAFKVQEFKGFNIEGFWVKVTYNNKTGYVFDGYLSSLPAAEKGNEIEWYLNTHFNKDGNKTVTERTDWFGVKNQPKSWYQKYKAGITYTFNQGEAGSNNTSEFDFISRRELYLIVKVLYDYDADNEWTIEEDNHIHYDQKDDSAGCYITISGNKKKATLEKHCGC